MKMIDFGGMLVIVGGIIFLFVGMFDIMIYTNKEIVRDVDFCEENGLGYTVFYDLTEKRITKIMCNPLAK